MSTNIRTANQKRIDLDAEAYLLRAPAEQGGDYDCFIRPGEYIGSRATEDLARACIAEQQEREGRHPPPHHLGASMAAVSERLQAAIAILEPCAGQLADMQTQQLIGEAIMQLRQTLLIVEQPQAGEERRAT
jgi:hypothetical protein